MAPILVQNDALTGKYKYEYYTWTEEKVCPGAWENMQKGNSPGKYFLLNPLSSKCGNCAGAL